MPMITTAPVKERDQSFLYELYASTRQEEMALTGWEVGQVDAFLRMQFRLRKNSYAMQYPSAEHSVILLAGLAVGAWIIDRCDSEIRLVDIAFLPAYRAKGFGTALLFKLQEEAAASKGPIRLQVDRQGAALRLYERLGFVATGGDGIRISMTWIPKISTLFASAIP